MSFQKPKGTQDFYPEEMAQRNAVFDVLRRVAGRYGFKEVSSPAFEGIDLLTKKEGEEIKQQIFVLEKKGTEEYGLRFDLTVPLTRMFMEKEKELQKPVKWFALDRMWRYERQQKGRQREFYQISLELFGSASVSADAEILSLAIDSLKAFGLTARDFYLKLNSRVLLQSLIAPLIGKAAVEDVIAVIDKKDKMPPDAFLEELSKLGVKAKEVSALIATPLEKLKPSTPEGKTALATINQLLELLGGNREYVRFDLSVARGLAYYTGIVFEAFDIAGNFRALLGGGRYDNMVEQFGGTPTPATGFAIGSSTLTLLLAEKGLLPASEQGIEYYVAPVSEKEAPLALELVSALRKKTSAETDLMGRNLGNQFKYASKIGARNVIVVGEDEVKSGVFTVKNMKTGKEEKKRRSDF
ncbi:MAG: histidine--tRNA ligase [Nanoarchaeota archaeon]|nr:histidine--tRNA ligase [Nanoarchaeota archaeon]